MKFTALAAGLLACSALVLAEPAKPLAVGDRLPDVTLRTAQDREVKLRDVAAKQVTALIFYRGGWCPYCNRQLKGLKDIEKQLRAAGVKLLAISPDQPAKLLATPDRESLGYELLSDADAQAIKAFGIAFEVDAATRAQYRGFGIDLEAASGRKHHLLPHPAVFVVDPTGVIRFAHVDPDYKVRLEPAKILAAATAAARP